MGIFRDYFQKDLRVVFYKISERTYFVNHRRDLSFGAYIFIFGFEKFFDFFYIIFKYDSLIDRSHRVITKYVVSDQFKT